MDTQNNDNQAIIALDSTIRLLPTEYHALHQKGVTQPNHAFHNMFGV